MMSSEVIQGEIKDLLRDLLKEARKQTPLLQKILAELEWITKKSLRDPDMQRLSVGNITIPPGEKHVIYTRNNRSGEVFLAIITSASTDLSLIVTVDNFTSLDFPKISDIYTPGITSPNNVLWTTLSAGVYALYSNFYLPFENKIVIECINKGSSNATLLESIVLGRLKQ